MNFKSAKVKGEVYVSAFDFAELLDKLASDARSQGNKQALNWLVFASQELRKAIRKGS